MTTSAHGCKECRQRPLLPAESPSVEQVHCFDCKQRILHSIVRRIDVLDGFAQQLYIGRSNYPERRLLQHFTDMKKPKAHKAWAAAKQRD